MFAQSPRSIYSALLCCLESDFLDYDQWVYSSSSSSSRARDTLNPRYIMMMWKDPDGEHRNVFCLCINAVGRRRRRREKKACFQERMPNLASSGTRGRWLPIIWRREWQPRKSRLKDEANTRDSAWWWIHPSVSSDVRSIHFALLFFFSFAFHDDEWPRVSTLGVYIGECRHTGIWDGRYDHDRKEIIEDGERERKELFVP